MKKEADSRLMEWTINKAKTEFKDDVCLMLERNTFTHPDELDVRHISRFISNSDKLTGLARTFIINGIGYDFWQNNWEKLERIAEVKDYYTTSLLDCELVYYKDEEDRQRFLYLQAKLRANLANPRYMYERGLEWLNRAMELYKILMFENGICQTRKNAGFIADYLSVAVACANQQYIKGGIESQIEHLLKMKYVPENFIELYKKIIWAKSVDELKSLSHDIIDVTRDFFKNKYIWENNEASEPDYKELAMWYQECSLYFQRLYYYCNNNMVEKAYNQGFHLQCDLDNLATDFHIADLDLLSSFNADNLTDYSTHAKSVESRMISAIEEKGVRIEAYSTVDDFLKMNP